MGGAGAGGRAPVGSAEEDVCEGLCSCWSFPEIGYVIKHKLQVLQGKFETGRTTVPGFRGGEEGSRGHRGTQP